MTKFEHKRKGKIKMSEKGLAVFPNNFIGLVFMKLKTLFIQLKIETKDNLGNRIWEYVHWLLFSKKKKVLFQMIEAIP